MPAARTCTSKVSHYGNYHRALLGPSKVLNARHADTYITPNDYHLQSATMPPRARMKIFSHIRLMHGNWISRKAGTTCLIFIHGVLSDSKKCWEHPNGSYWPKLVANDPDMENFSIYIFTYKTGFLSSDYGISDAVDSLKENLRLDGIFSFDNIIFVCHSMGGIITRKFLIDAESEIGRMRIGLFLLGSPSYGSKKASLLSYASRLCGNLQTQALIYVNANPWLKDLHKNFKNLQGRLGSNLIGKELVEDTKTFLAGKIVEEHSAALYFPDSYKVPNSNHSTLVKLESADAIQHRLLRKFVIENFSRSNKIIPNGVGVAADPLFEIYEKKHEPYYLHRAIDDELKALIQQKSIWIHGSTGSGKTSLVRRLLSTNKGASIEISLSIPTNDSPGVLREIAESLAIKLDRKTSSTPSAAEVVELIGLANRNLTLVLFMDEVPINKSGSVQVVDVVAGLHDSIRRQGYGDVRFIACSIGEPTSEKNQRLFEQFTLLRVKLWDTSEIHQLINQILDHIHDIKLNDYEFETLKKNACGSPRFIKTFFRDLRQSVGTGNNFDTSLAKTHEILRTING